MNRVEFGDCRATMRAWAAAGVKAQMCVTSPPYFGLRDARPSLPALRRPADLAHPAVPDTEAGQDRAMQAGDEGLDGLRAQRGGAAQAGEAGRNACGAGIINRTREAWRVTC